ncbi:MAG: serine hydrolase [Opitutae bacterium]|nr:serine hydrolase [Opitutae bacterium]
MNLNLLTFYIILTFLSLGKTLLASTGLAPEVTDLNAQDVSYEREKDLPYLEKPFISLAPGDRKDQLPVGSLGKDGGDKKLVLKYARTLAEKSEDPKSGKTDSLLIAYKGKLLFESYFRRGRVNYPHYQMSITKSYTTMALGRAMQLGYLSMEDLDKPALSFLKKLDASKLTKGASKITLHEAMHMSSGIRLPKKKINELIDRPERLLGQGQIQAYLQFSTAIPPYPRDFKYQAADPSITMQVLQSVVPGSAGHFIRDELLKPMGILNYGWQEDLSGFPKSAAGSSLRSRDMIKMGLLTLHQGKWKGKQHLPKAFVKRATSPLVQTNGENFYGYFWWSQTREINGKKYPIIQGRGAGGQFIFVFPTLDLVVAATAHNKGMGKMLKELPEILIPSFTNS